jgi:hypothetical protein
MVFQMLLLGKRSQLKAHGLSIVQRVERWKVCTPSSVNVFITPAIELHLEYHCKGISETPCITSKSHIASYLTQIKLCIFCYIKTVKNTVYVP